jgi:hypothetical protein
MDFNQTAQQNPVVPNDGQQATQGTGTVGQPAGIGSIYKPTTGFEAGTIEHVTSLHENTENGIHHNFETTPPAPEKITDNETIATPETNQPPTAPAVETPNQTNGLQNASTVPDKPKIVDQTKVVTKLHPLAGTADAITSLADQEEEEFIQQVEAAHGLN